MERVSLDEIEPDSADPDRRSDRRPLSDRLGTTDVSIAHYTLEPGERFSGSLHTHIDQEEIFVVLEGEATFETKTSGETADADGLDVSAANDGETGGTDEVVVGETEAIRFAPGEFQTGRNAADERLVALALGAPKDSTDVRIARIPVLDDLDVSCPACERDNMALSRGDDADFECPTCGELMTLE